MFEQHAREHGVTRNAILINRHLLRDIYAMQLFEAERSQNNLAEIDVRLRWDQITKADRDIYRDLANRLSSEALE